MCGDCPNAVRCVLCSRFRALRMVKHCKLLAHYHLYHHDALVRSGTVCHKKWHRAECQYTGCLTLDEVWEIEDHIRGIQPEPA